MPKRLIFLALIIGLWCRGAAFAETAATAPVDANALGLELATAADAKEFGYQDLQVELEMILRTDTGRESRRALTIRQLEIAADGDKMLLVFAMPKAIKGTALLSFAHRVGADEQWLFLPALKRVKKITSKNRSGPFLSSEFAFEDLTPQEVEKYTYRYLRTQACGDLVCDLVERVPLDEFTGYSRQELWLDKDELRTQRIDYFDRRNELLKTLNVSAYALYADRFWRPAAMLMVNHQTQKSTELKWRNYQFGNGFTADRDFSANTLRRVR